MKVVCIKIEPGLVIGKTYEVRDQIDDYYRIRVGELMNCPYDYFPTYAFPVENFMTIDEMRNEKLNKILDESSLYR